MKGRLLIMLAVWLGLCASSCTRTWTMTEIFQVSYSEASGTILPEMQLREEIVITRDSSCSSSHSSNW